MGEAVTGEAVTGMGTETPLERDVVRAAGGIVLRAAEAGGWEVALVHRPMHADWTLPKGKLEAGETSTECALREVLEETGYRCELGRFVGEVEYLDRRDRRKIVSYWLMQPLEGTFEATPEVDELAWLSLDEAGRRLSYAHDGELLASVRTPLSATTDQA
jgi:8-oxo-dGTP diphosphatase